MSQRFSTDIAGKELVIESGLLARQANGAVTVRYGETVVLATIVMSKGIRAEIDYFPLMVDYEEKLYAAGKIKGSRFIKREGRPTDESILKGRLIDRAMRPLFPQHIQNDIQIIVSVLSYDGENDPATLGLIAASAAATISNIPFKGPIAGLRIGLLEGEPVCNPTREALESSDLDMVVAVTGKKVIMLEAGAKEVPEAKIAEAIAYATEQAQPILKLTEQVQEAIGKEKVEIPAPEVNQELKAAIEAYARPKLEEILYGKQTTKQIRKDLVKKLGSQTAEELAEQFPEEKIEGKYWNMVDEVVTDNILQKERRPGNRELTEIRPLEVQVGVLPRPHGTGYFMRGETQALTTTTLAGPGAEQIIDGMDEEYKKSFMHHYNFPPYSVGEARPLRGPSRRDIGHGSLAEKALEPVIPAKEDFPYTIRLVSEVMGSNGSSSMASTCGSTLALMDAGVPIKAPVAGIAMGVASNEAGDYKVLTDIQDLEDGQGGMDFKVTGTLEGITAIQMDTKTLGIEQEITEKVLTQGRQARIELLDAMAQVIEEPRKELSKYAPRIEKMQINPEKIRDVIGPGGKIINEIIEKTGVDIDIEQSGLVFITSETGGSMKDALAWIERLVKEAKPGEEYKGKVVRIEAFGAFVELWEGTDGLVHVSKIAEQRIENVQDVLKMGQIVNVKVDEIDEKGRVSLTMKGLNPDLKLPPAGGGGRPQGRYNNDRRKPSGGGSGQRREQRPPHRPSRPPAAPKAAPATPQSPKGPAPTQTVASETTSSPLDPPTAL